MAKFLNIQNQPDVMKFNPLHNGCEESGISYNNLYILVAHFGGQFGGPLPWPATARYIRTSSLIVCQLLRNTVNMYKVSEQTTITEVIEIKGEP